MNMKIERFGQIAGDWHIILDILSRLPKGKNRPFHLQQVSQSELIQIFRFCFVLEIFSIRKTFLSAKNLKRAAFLINCYIFFHTFRLTAYSLYAAVSVGLQVMSVSTQHTWTSSLSLCTIYLRQPSLQARY